MFEFYAAFCKSVVIIFKMKTIPGVLIEHKYFNLHRETETVLDYVIFTTVLTPSRHRVNTSALVVKIVTNMSGH